MPAGTYDVIVAGIGGMGSAACWQLAKRGQRVLGLERFDIPNAMGSSHGLTRIIRLAYHEGLEYVPLLQRAMVLWREAGAAYGEPLMFTTGSLDAGPGGGGFFTGALAACEEHDLPHEILEAVEINRRFPAFRLPPGHRGLFQKDGGFIASERAIVAHATLAQAAGAEIHARERLLEWHPIGGGGVRIVTDRGRYEAGRLVLSAGAWMGELVPELQKVAVPERQVLGWFQPGTPADFMPDRFPVSILDVEEGPYYLLPIWGGPGVKIGLHHHRGQRGPVDTLSRDAEAADEEALRRCIARYLPDANGPTMALRPCFYTVTPDEHFIIDTLPGNPDIILASPCSGHGYKFAAVIGEVLADLAAGRKPAFDLGMFRLARF
ncbi:MAG TPA: N-methyl-L-tryptophan oxidase [Bauldia sp.]|nr:N-methyl-L-tryptophan oxidase [Bauldia sp.]